MKFRALLTAATAALLLSAPLLRSQPATAPAVPASAADDAEADLNVLLERVKAKLQTGQTTEAALADELKRFDELLAKHASEQTDTVAMIGVMKAKLYIEVFENYEKGIDVLKQVKSDFPQTHVAGEVDAYIAGLQKQIEQEKVTAIGQPLAPFSEKDLDGQPLELASYRGKIVLVDFWATWCGPCVGELPNVLAAYQKYHDQGFEIVGISLDKDRAALTSFIKDRGMTWRQYFDGQGWQNKLAEAYGIQSIPATFLLDRDGKIVAKNLRGEALDAKLAELLGGK
jgi:peroxiredoxin